LKILGLIPARGGSKGVPKKNIKLLGDIPLIAYTITSAQKSNLLTKCILSSEDTEIITTAKKYNIDNPIIRPFGLATDDAKSIDVVLYTLEELEKRGEYFDAVCLLQPTSPFRDADLIDRCIKKFIEHDYDALITVEKVPDEYNPHWIFEETETGYLKLSVNDEKIISRRQELPITYKRDGSVYLTKTTILKNMHSFYGKNLGFIEVPIGQINIDNTLDWHRAESFIKENHVRY
jgi:CMP-N,N'-diacetyllegionaminic acid synthase